MKGCLGCLVLLVVLALLAWPIETLGQLLGWSNTQTGYVLLALVALVAVGAAREREAIAVKRGEAREARAAVFRSGYRTVQARGMAAPRHLRPGDRPMGGGGALGDRVVDAPAGGGGIPGHQGVPRARDPLPAALRFRILARDGFRCRYCGRPGTAPGVVLHVDHVVPVAAGGATSEDNLRTACEECNLGKGTRGVVAADSSLWSVPLKLARSRGSLLISPASTQRSGVSARTTTRYVARAGRGERGASDKRLVGRPHPSGHARTTRATPVGVIRGETDTEA